MNGPICNPSPPQARHRTPPIRGSPGRTTSVFPMTFTCGLSFVKMIGGLDPGAPPGPLGDDCCPFDNNLSGRW